MRQIKFRAYHNRAQKMLESGTNRQVFAWQDEGQDITIMQFTGLTDVNGKEIYEGDIVDFCFDGVIFIGNGNYVVFENGAFLIKKKNFSPLVSDAKAVEVIGNIYEHPHLLNEER